MTEIVEHSTGAMEIEEAVDELDRCAVEEVELTVPKTDDPTLPVLTFRMWVLGLAACIILSFVNQFFWYRQMPLTITGISAQIAVVPLGHLMARVLPNKKYLEGSRWEFNMNPGPFNIKEHVMITIFANSGAGTQTRGAFKRNKKMDIHTRIMKKNYREVPMWWFLVILVLNIALIVFISVYYNATVQLPWWGVLLACAIAVFFTPLIGVILATTNQAPGLNVITEYVIGYIYPERPVANMCFKVYGYISMTQALTFIQDFKLGLYMKIPPRSMYLAQVVGTLVAVLVYTGTAWWLMVDIPHLCDKSLLPDDSQWTCPMDRVFFDASVIWGLVGPRRMFGDLGEYSAINWFFLVGAITPFFVWLATKAFPAQKWISQIHFPVILGATSMMPPAMAVNFTSWCIVAFIFGHFVFKYKREWWTKYNYVLSGGLDAGTAFMTILIFLALGRRGIGLAWWGNADDSTNCGLASCPTAKGVVTQGCPVF
ncbi:hypothetical protein BRARA_J00850 [Brassica rapa]|uniref:Oligopeptide transporter n=1 Tax=Brassica campestris TaxID=3711 RepID=A0A397XKN2_BRACM|nr:hypothetical protein BRARA_J00850 [Brassica rapa]